MSEDIHLGVLNPDTHLPPNWIRRLLGVLGAPIVPENIDLLWAWQRAEGGNARYNPLNTTFILHRGETNYNVVGVKNYKLPIDGLCATALTLTNGFYPGILGALDGGKKTAKEIVNEHASEFRKWGTGAFPILRILETQ